jgi:hypothetical protein
MTNLIGQSLGRYHILELFRFTPSTVYGWAREGWDDTDAYYICQ